MSAVSGDKKYFLCREGKVYGPLNGDQLEDLKHRGELIRYSWLWSSESNTWEPATPPPPPPLLTESREVSSSASLLVICHNNRSMVSGVMSKISGVGCHFKSTIDSPPFRAGAPVWLSLLNESKSRSEELRAQIKSVTRKSDGSWEYEVQWKQAPTILND